VPLEPPRREPTQTRSIMQRDKRRELERFTEIDDPDLSGG
jgi:hypothetical protein